MKSLLTVCIVYLTIWILGVFGEFFLGGAGGEVSLVCEEFSLCFGASIVYKAIYEFHWHYDGFIGTFKDSIKLEKFHGA